MEFTLFKHGHLPTDRWRMDKSMIYVGIDNGISGSVGIVDANGVGYQYPTPTKSCLNYQKTKVKNITRIDVKALREMLCNIERNKVGMVAIERPMVNPQRFEATTSALRALEATIIVLESLGLGYEYIDSKEWQKKMLPYISVKDKKEYPAKLKEVSKQVGMRMFPSVEWDKFKDADGILIAKYLMEKYNGA
jgi:hypothetical protein